jgi:hypothetical protein
VIDELRWKGRKPPRLTDKIHESPVKFQSISHRTGQAGGERMKSDPTAQFSLPGHVVILYNGADAFFQKNPFFTQGTDPTVWPDSHQSDAGIPFSENG